MTNFSKKLEDASETDLYSWVNELDYRVVPLASDELTRRELKKLSMAIGKNSEELAEFTRQSIRFNEETSEQTAKMVNMTKTVTTLTKVMVVGLFLQILLAIPRTHECVPFMIMLGNQ